MPLELAQTNPLTLTSHFDSAAELQLRHGQVELSAHGDHVLVRNDAPPVQVELIAPEGWTLSASHEDDDGEVTWDAGPRGASLILTDWTVDPLEVTVTATTAAETKKKKVYIEAKPGGALPDRS